LRQSEHNDLKKAAALKAINILGGPKTASEKIFGLTGKRITPDRIGKWRVNGIAPGWHPTVHLLTQIPLTDLDPDLYPSFLFQG